MNNRCHLRTNNTDRFISQVTETLMTRLIDYDLNPKIVMLVE